jgi:TolB-like protein
MVINDVVVDLDGESLTYRDGSRVALRPQTFAMLRHLLANPDRLVTKDELIQAIWHGAAVTDDSLVQCVHEIRRSLNDERHAVLQTVPRRGYRLIISDAPRNGPPSRPTLVVLPFRNLGQQGASGHFAEGLTEDLVISLSRIRGLAVIASRISPAGDPRDVAAKFGARYLVGGSVRRSGKRLRITADLIDGASGAYVWAGRFDGATTDLFDLQDRLVDQIVGVVEPSIRRVEIERARRKRPESLDAYDLYLRAVPHVLANTREDGAKALAMLDAALRIDPSYLPAHGYAAWGREQRYLRGGFDPADRSAALAHADMALGVNSDDPQVISIAAFVRANLTRDYDAAIEAMDRALAMNDNSALVLGFSALVSAHSERHARAADHAQKALRLSPPDDPMNYHPFCALTLASLFSGAYAEAVKFAALTIRANPGFSVAHAYLVASLVNLGDLEAARTAAHRLLEVAPGFTARGFARTNLYRAPLMEGLARALERAGLPAGQDSDHSLPQSRPGQARCRPRFGSSNP